MPRFIFVVVAGFAVLGSTAPASAQEIFCTVVGAKQGTFKGDLGGGKASQIAVLSLTQEVIRPFDSATGQATGVLTHKPLTIVKELDGSSPQFFAAAVNNETLNSVKCTFYRTFRSGGGINGINEMRAYFKIDLTNARIVEYKDAGDGVNGTAQGDERERISLTYQRIDLTDIDSNTAAEDFWSVAL